MKICIHLGCLLLALSSTQAQPLQFALKDHLILPATRGIHDISGIEYIKARNEWHLVSDRGKYYIFRKINALTDFLNPEDSTFASDMRFEAVRYDSLSRSYFYAVEYNRRAFTGFRTGTIPRLENQVQKIDSLSSLPADNKGIEALTVTPSSIWIAPEAGLPGEATLTNNTIHFYRYTRQNGLPTTKTLYAYPIDRHPALKNPRYDTEKLGGISDILAVNDTQLLVVEKYYDEKQDKVFASLYLATTDHAKTQLNKRRLFNFNEQLNGLRVDNLEGMTWGPRQPNGKRTLVLVSDDNGGKCPRDDGGICQITQLLLLEEQ